MFHDFRVLPPGFFRNFSKSQNLKFLQVPGPSYREKAVYDDWPLASLGASIVQAPEPISVPSVKLRISPTPRAYMGRKLGVTPSPRGYIEDQSLYGGELGIFPSLKAFCKPWILPPIQNFARLSSFPHSPDDIIQVEMVPLHRRRETSKNSGFSSYIELELR